MILGMKGQGNNGEWLTGTSGWPHVAEWLTGTSQGREILDRVARTEEELRGQWEVGSMGSPGGNEYPENCWSVGLTQVGTDERKQVIFSEYPGEIFYTNEEVTRLGITVEIDNVDGDPSPTGRECVRREWDFREFEADENGDEIEEDE